MQRTLRSADLEHAGPPVDLVDGLSLLALSRALEGRRAEAYALAVRARSAARCLGTDEVSVRLPDAVLAWATPAGPTWGHDEGRDDLTATIVALVRAGLAGSRGDPTEPHPGSRRARRPKPGRSRHPASPDTGDLVDALTPKEREVLALLGDLLTTDEIAQSMFVSVNTVKTHIRGILRKLDVSRRHEAVRRARALQLIA